MKYNVEMHYKDFATIQITIEANDRTEAERKAKEHGKFMGFTSAIKKYVVRVAENEAA